MNSRSLLRTLLCALAVALTRASNSAISVQNCDNSIVAVESVSILCDSPYTYYWGNGAHRNSRYCNYGDKAKITINFNITENLVNGEDIYLTLGVYAARSDYELLYSLRAMEMCSNFLGEQCVYAGSYSFTLSASFNFVDGSGLSEFIPFVEMGFSTYADEGYNLGGANIECWINDNENFEEYNPWLSTNSTHINAAQKAVVFVSNYAILFGVVALLSGFAFITWKNVGHQATCTGTVDEVGLLSIGSPTRTVA